MTVLVTGARGHIARSLITRLTSAGTPFRAASSRPEPGEFRLDLSTGEGLGPALDGVDRVLLYTQPDGIDAFLDAARDVKHIVQVSSSAVDQPDAATNSIALRHKVVEDKLLASGLPVTVLRPGAFATNALQWWGETIRRGSTVEDANPEARFAPIHQDDIAAVAQTLLDGGGHLGEALTLTGPESLTVRQQVAILGEVLGREIPVARISRQEALARRPDYIPVEVMESLLDTFAASVGRPALVSDAVRAITGVPARTFRQWAEDHRTEFVARQG
ncbi:NAD(P)H-binding protein [Kutzneria sp. NPDC052558]|uniref:NAD(P)H-binding protein n=1 Tax=Kutzneria sp. NPDC052558 TaxID=3364121 RepID=UPI0037CB974A